MATKLKNMRLTSVDLVKAGANQEADICLYKSADAEHTSQEAPEAPTEAEKNIFKRFIGWLRDGGAEDGTEPDGTIEKGNAPEPDAEPADIYKSAILESAHSILADDSLTNDQKSAMIEKSLDQYHEATAEIYKYNENHDRLGRFTPAVRGGGRAGRTPAAGGGTESAKVAAYHKRCQALATTGGNDISGTLSKDKVKGAIERGGKFTDFKGKSYLISPQKDGLITTYTGTRTKSGGMKLERYASGIRTTEDAQDWGIGTILNSIGKSASFPDEWGIDRFDEIEEINS